jgi:hypothetical protein
MKRPSNLPLRLYTLLLVFYPHTFRARRAVELWQTVRDLAEETDPQNIFAAARFWLAIYADTLAGALAERWHVMRNSTRNVWEAWLALSMTLLAVVVSVGASLDLYLLEDNNPLTTAAYSASPLLRFSYTAAYVAALVAGVAGVAAVAFAIIPARAALWSVLGLAALVALGGFGGLLVRRPLTGLTFIGAFAALCALGLFIGWRVARTLMRRTSERAAILVGACAGAVVALLADAAALITHTLALNPVSHALYMQFRIGDTPYNAALIGMVVQTLLVACCAASLAAALWSASRHTRGGGAQ